MRASSRLRPGLTLAIALAVAIAGLALSAEPARADHRTVTAGGGLVESVRWAGESRVDTANRIAAEFSAEQTSAPADVAVVARADAFPDALAGSFLAGQFGGPILLTGGAALDPATAQTLTGSGTGELGVSTVYLLGGTQAISQDVEDDLGGRGVDVRRIAGSGRNETAVEIATAESTTVGQVNGLPTAILARNDSFPDALVAGALSAGAQLPLLLTEPGALSAVTAQALTELGIRQVLIAGGANAVAPEVETQVQARGIATVRLGGDSRTATAVAFARYADENLGFRSDQVSVARGDAFPDALALGPFAGRERFSVLLSGGANELGGDTRTYLSQLATCEFSRLFVAGGVNALAQLVEDDARRALTAADCDPGQPTPTPSPSPSPSGSPGPTPTGSPSPGPAPSGSPTPAPTATPGPPPIDTEPPAAAAVTPQGIDVRNARLYNVAGTAEPGATVEVRVRGLSPVTGALIVVAREEGTVNADGTFSVTLDTRAVPDTTQSPNGRTVVEVGVRDAAGNETEQDYEVVKDTAPSPVDPSAVGVAFTAVSRTIISGTAPANAGVVVRVDDRVAGVDAVVEVRVTADPAGAWSTPVDTTALSGSPLDVYAAATDFGRPGGEVSGEPIAGSIP